MQEWRVRVITKVRGEKLAEEIYIVPYSRDLSFEWWNKIKDSSGYFKELDGHTFNGFDYLLGGSVGLIRLGDFGYARLTNYENNFKANLHGAFWNSSLFGHIKDLRHAIQNIILVYNIQRLEVKVPAKIRSLQRLMSKLGFYSEGILRNAGRGENFFFDQEVYSIIREDL